MVHSRQIQGILRTIAFKHLDGLDHAVLAGQGAETVGRHVQRQRAHVYSPHGVQTFNVCACGVAVDVGIRVS